MDAHKDASSEQDEERQRELLRRVLQYDIEDAVARYEAETGLCVSRLNLSSTGSSDFAFELEAYPGAAHKRPPVPVTGMLVLNLSR